MSGITALDSLHADQPPQEDNHPLPLSLFSLPKDIVLRCLAHIPRSYYLNLSLVSKTLSSLVRSPELNRLRSLLHKKPLYIGFCESNDPSTYHWLTLEKTRATTEYQLVPIPFPSHPFKYGFSTVYIGSDFYFISRVFESPSELWILDTRSGKLTQGPSMKVQLQNEAVGVIDGKIYVIGVVGFAGCDEKIQVEVFDPESKSWRSAGQEKVPPRPWFQQFIASMERKIYMVECGRTTVYNPKEGEGERLTHIVSERLVENKGRRKERLCEIIYEVCVVENVLFACYEKSGLMWFDTKLNVWRRLVNREGKEVYRVRLQAMAEYEGKLAVFQTSNHVDRSDNYTKKTSVKMFLIALDWVGERICGTVEWSGIVSTIPRSSIFSF